LLPAEPAKKMEKLAWEKELLGLYVSDNPLAEYLDFFRQFSKPVSEVDESYVGQTVTIGGIIEKVKKIFLKSQKSMAFVEIEDASGQKMEIIAFPKIFEQYGGLFQEGKMVLATGKISSKDDSLKLLCDEVRLVNQEEIERYRALENQRRTEIDQEKSFQKVFLKLPQNSNSELLRKISTILNQAKSGNSKIYLEIPDERFSQIRRLETPFRIDYDREVAKKIREILEKA